MSSLHPDRLPTGGPAPDQGTSPTLAAAPGTTSRRATGTATVTASSTTRRTQRRGSLPTAPAAEAPARRARRARTVTVTVARTATATAARTASATAKVAATGARAATSRAAKAMTPAPAKAPKPAATEQAPAVRRPTPHPRTPEPVLEPLPASGAPAVEHLVLPGDTRRSPAPGGLLRHRRLPVGPRSSLYLAAAAATVIGISGGLASAGPDAQAGTRTAGAALSVAEQLGIPEQTASPIVDAETADRLGELVATRAERDAEQVAAAQVQATADHAAAESARLAAEAAAEAARPDAVLPVEGARLTSRFGPRWGTLHAGIDLAAPMRTPEFAVMDGVVLEAGPASGYGLAVYIQHENGDVTVYGHMDEILVSAGQVVAAGDTIALLGNTGQSTGPHLHFEVHQGGLEGTKIDPVPWLAERGVHV